MTLTTCMRPAGICDGYECRYCGLHVDECVQENEACLQDEQYKTDAELLETSTGKVLRTLAQQRLVFSAAHTMAGHNNADHTAVYYADLPLSNARQPDLNTFTFHTSGAIEPVEDVIIYSTDTPSPRFTIRTIPRPLHTPTLSEVSVDTGQAVSDNWDMDGGGEIVQLDDDEVLVDDPSLTPIFYEQSPRLNQMDGDSLGGFSSDGSVSECTEIPVSFATEVVIPAQGPAKTVISFYPHGDIEESPGRRSVRRVTQSMISQSEETTKRKVYYRREDVNHHVPKILDKRKTVGLRNAATGAVGRDRGFVSPDFVVPPGDRTNTGIVQSPSAYLLTSESPIDNAVPDTVPEAVRLVPDADLYRVFYPDRLHRTTSPPAAAAAASAPLTTAHVHRPPSTGSGNAAAARSRSQPAADHDQAYVRTASLSPTIDSWSRIKPTSSAGTTNHRTALVSVEQQRPLSAGVVESAKDTDGWLAVSQPRRQPVEPVVDVDSGVVNGSKKAVKGKGKARVEWDERVDVVESRKKKDSQKGRYRTGLTGQYSTTDTTYANVDTMPASSTTYSLHKTPVVHNKISPLLRVFEPTGGGRVDRDGDASTLSSMTLPFHLDSKAKLASSKASSVSDVLDNYPVSPSPSLADSALSYTSRGSGNRVTRRSHATIYLNDEEQRKSRSKVDLTVASEAGVERDEVRKFPEELLLRRSSSASSSTSGRGTVQKMTITMLLSDKKPDDTPPANQHRPDVSARPAYSAAPVRAASASVFRSQMLPVKLSDGELQRRAYSYRQRDNKQPLSASEVELCRPEYLVAVHQHHPQILSMSSISNYEPVYERRTPSRVVSREGRELEAIVSKPVPYRSYERLDVENEDGGRVIREVKEELKNNVVTVQVHEKGDKLSKDKLAEVKNDELKDSVATNGKIGRMAEKGELALEKPASPPRSRREKYELHQAMSWKRDIELRPASEVDGRLSGVLVERGQLEPPPRVEPVAVREVTRVAEASRAVSAPSYNAVYQPPRPVSPLHAHTSMISSTMSATTTTHRSIQYRSIFDKSYTDGRVSELRKSASDLRALAGSSLDDTSGVRPDQVTSYSSYTLKSDYTAAAPRRPFADHNAGSNFVSRGDFSYSFPNKSPTSTYQTDYKENVLPRYGSKSHDTFNKSSETVGKYTDYTTTARPYRGAYLPADEKPVVADKAYKCSYPPAPREEKPVVPDTGYKCTYPPVPPVRGSSRLTETEKAGLSKDNVPVYRKTEKDPEYKLITQYKSTPLLTTESTYVRDFVKKQEESVSYRPRETDSYSYKREPLRTPEKVTEKPPEPFSYKTRESPMDTRSAFTVPEKTTEKRSESFSYKSFQPATEHRPAAFKTPEPVVEKVEKITAEPRSASSSWAYGYKLPEEVHVRTSSQSSAGTLPREKKSLEPAIIESLRTKKPSPPSSPDIRPKDWVPPCKAKILQAKRKFMNQQSGPVAPPVRIDPWDKYKGGSRDKLQLRMSRESLEAINREATRGSVRRDNRYSMPDLRGSQKTLADPSVYRSKINWPERDIQRKLSESQEYLERRGRSDYDAPTTSFANRWDSRSRSLPPMSRYSKSAATTPIESPYPEYIDSNKAKSMEFLADVKKYDYQIVPENQLQRENISGYSRSRGPGDEKEDNQYVEQVRKSLQKLDLPDWYVNSPYSQPGVMEGTLLRHRTHSATDSNYSPYNTLDRSELTSPTGTMHSTDAVVISKRILPESYHKTSVTESKKSLSTSREDKVWDLYTGPFYNKKSRPTPIYSPASESHSHRPYNPHDSGWSSDWNSHHESSQDSDESNTESRTSPRNWTAHSGSDWYRSPLGERRREKSEPSRVHHRPVTEGHRYEEAPRMYFDPITKTERRVINSTPWEVTSVKTETFKTERVAKKNFITETNDPVKIAQFNQDSSQWGSYV
ncbi:uncharacterized protein LOC129594239 [Paramacrobiotus metropolitanus]|uniref:uncharacterized protein LOC129594239 n=1 Tax=Paramacrobiotus metropolitanus TaxID=2943436 RepID=UPI0024458685|nr:uncharacterized protein LOC129594239 [Paramacrobiotus metropolitanus]